MDILELISTIGIIVSVYIVVFTSEQLTKITNLTDETMYILAFVAMHLIFGLKYLLAILIQDEPSWVVEDYNNVENRIKQIQEDNQDKKLIQRMDINFEPIKLLTEVLKNQHENDNLSFQLVPNLKRGCEIWLEKNEQAQNSATY